MVGAEGGGVYVSTVAVDLFCWDESEQAGGGFEMHMRKKGWVGGWWRVQGVGGAVGGGASCSGRFVLVLGVSQLLSHSATYPCLGKHPH